MHLSDVAKVAVLARLELTDSEMAQMSADLQRILTHMERLEALDLTDVEPFFWTREEGQGLRQDQPRTGLSQEEALAPAPTAVPPFFRVQGMR